MGEASGDFGAAGLLTAITRPAAPCSRGFAGGTVSGAIPPAACDSEPHTSEEKFGVPARPLPYMDAVAHSFPVTPAPNKPRG